MSRRLTGSLNGQVWPGASSPTHASAIGHAAANAKNRGHGNWSRRATKGPTTAITTGTAQTARIWLLAHAAVH